MRFIQVKNIVSEAVSDTKTKGRTMRHIRYCVNGVSVQQHIYSTDTERDISEKIERTLQGLASVMANGANISIMIEDEKGELPQESEYHIIKDGRAIMVAIKKEGEPMHFIIRPDEFLTW